MISYDLSVKSGTVQLSLSSGVLKIHPSNSYYFIPLGVVGGLGATALTAAHLKNHPFESDLCIWFFSIYGLLGAVLGVIYKSNISYVRILLFLK